MRYRVVVPISHSGQRIPLDALVSDSDKYGIKAKSPLSIARLLERGRIVPFVEPALAAPSAPETDPALEPALELTTPEADPPKAKPKEKKF